MKHLIILLFLGNVINAQFFENSISEYACEYLWSNNLSDWELNAEILSDTSMDGKLIETIYHYPVSNTAFKTAYQYNQDLLTKITASSTIDYLANIWVEDREISYFYNINEEVISRLEDYLNSDQDRLSRYVFNNTGLLDSIIVTKQNGTNVFELNYQVIRNYENDLLSEEIRQVNDGQGGAINDKKVNFVYNSSEIALDSNYVWVDSLASWVYDFHMVYEQVDFSLLEEKKYIQDELMLIRQEYVSNGLTDSIIQFSYDASLDSLLTSSIVKNSYQDEKLVLTTTEIRNESNDGLRYSYKEERSYVNNQMQSSISYYWDVPGDRWAKSRKYLHDCNNLSSVNELHEIRSLVLYPNPFKHVLSGFGPNEDVLISNSLGQVVQLTSNELGELILSDLTNGCYIISAKGLKKKVLKID